MPSTTGKSKKTVVVMPETQAVARMQMDLAAYDQKFRQMNDELELKRQVAESLMRITDEAIVMAVNVQLIKTEAQLNEQKPNFARLEGWFRQRQHDVKRLMT